LFEAIFKDDVRDRLRTSLGEVHKQGAGLRLRLRMAGLSELGNYPWEFMYDPSLSRFLALSVDTPIVRYLETSQVIQPLTVQPPLRILAMICSPKDYPRLDVEREWENLREAMQDLQSQGLVDLQRLEPPTLSALQQILRREQFHIFHFVGHGTFSTAQQDGMLLLEDERREGYRLSGRDLGTLLHDHRPLRLAVLNACEGARTSSEDQFAGTAQSLMQQGIPAVIAMQIRITDQAAIVLSHEFYGALADGYPVDAALTEARKAIKTQGNDLEWGTPVLYMRSPDGQIFDIAQPAMTKRPPSVPAPDPKETTRIERIYTEALESFYLGKWEEAHNRLQEVVDSQPNHKDAAAKLEIVRRKLHLQTFDEQAATAEKASDWDKAIEALEKLLAEDPTFAEATSRLAKARRQKQLADLYAEAQQLTKAEKWQAVLEIFREIDNVQPRNPDPQGLRASAEQNLAKAKKMKDIETAYTSALTALDSGQWQDAIRHLRRVRGLQAGYRETESLLRRAESELEQSRKQKREPQKREQKVKTAVGQSVHPEWLILAMFVGFALSRAIPEILLGGPVFAWIENNSNTYLALSIYMPIFGALAGMCLWWMLHKAAVKLSRRQVLFTTLTPSIMMTTLMLGAYYFWNELNNNNWVWTVMFACFGLSIGTLLAIILRKCDPTFNRNQALTIIFGWGFAFFLGQITQQNLYPSLAQLLKDERQTNIIALPIEAGLAGLIGSMFLIGQLKSVQHFSINWKTVLAGTLGFGLGNLLTNILVAPLENSPVIASIQMLVWGLIGGASLAVPSKNFRHYLALGLLGGLGMMLGYLASIALGNPDGLNRVITGMVLGVFLGFRTRRVSAALILALVAPMGYFLRSILNNYYYTSNRYDRS
jgi:tetratricopeptide (TPR) repeat protein